MFPNFDPYPVGDMFYMLYSLYVLFPLPLSLGIYRDLMGISGDLRRFVGICGDFWVSLEMSANLYGSLGICGDLWESLGISENHP